MNRLGLSCACLGLLLATSAAWGDALAIIGAVKGKVEVVAAGSREARRGVSGMSLERGDRLTAARGAAVTLFFSDGNIMEVGESSSITIGGRARGSATAVIPSAVFAPVSQFVTGGSRQTGLVAMSSMRGEAREILVAPRKTSVMDPRPAFVWRAVPGATRYVVVLSSQKGELWRRETPDTTLAYPSDEPPLGEGEDILWEVEARSDSGRQHAESSFFQIMDGVAAGEVHRHLTLIAQSLGAETRVGLFLAGSYLAGVGLHQDAIQRFEALRQVDPESPGPREALARAYAAVGLMDLAAREYEAALALSR